MSRNMRHRSTPPPAQKMPQSSPPQSQDSDSDDDYGGVDDISGSEDDEPNVEVAEERAIISSEGEEIPVIPRPYEEYGQWEGFSFQGDGAPLDGQFFDQAIEKSSSVNESYDEDAAIEKHVHWESPVESESETIGDSDADEFWPDLFVDKNEIDPHLLRQIEADDVNGQFSDDGFFYGEAETDDDLEESSDASSDSSGYDSDESGMTTDEEDLSSRFIPPQRSVLRAISEASTSSEEVTRRRVFRAPVLASWTHNSDTPYAMADISSTKVKVFNMRRFREQYEMQSRATPMTTPRRNVLQESPMISNSGNIMMSAMMSDPFSDNISGQAIGGPEAFYPWTYVDANGTIENQDSSSVAGSDCDDEDLWNIDDLLNFGNQDSDDEEEAEPSDESPTGAEDTPGAPSSTPARPTTARSEDQVHPLLDHFSSGTVGAFRFNQNRHQLLNRTSVTRESLAFGNAHMEGTIRGVKAGRLQHANTPITPVRKKKRPIPFESSPASPTPYNANKKRKYNGDDRPAGLKRTRGLTM
ncbi:hypothetical protein DL95DRAFT_125603 [Leptodontidium sp. 2 PMI_412]|nr:hypothetical protein BKA61DRAFT_35036 [Leptodontidium sp. MPI-SDFR-AT-0119]KAH9223106.1 hypothetical protein DL95DRAFT_125603 [Leptodontidium sp. 2 PMI_412]